MNFIERRFIELSEEIGAFLSTYGFTCYGVSDAPSSYFLSKDNVYLVSLAIENITLSKKFDKSAPHGDYRIVREDLSFSKLKKIISKFVQP